MPFMPAVSLNQWSGALPKRGIFFPAKVFLRFASSFVCFVPCCAVQSFGPLNVCCPNASDSFGTRFKLLSAGAGFKHGDLCNEQIRDSNERSNLSLRVLFAQAPLQTRAVAAKKFFCGEEWCKFSGGFPPSFGRGEFSLSDYLVECIIKPSFSGVVCPMDKRHKSMAKRRAA